MDEIEFLFLLTSFCPPYSEAHEDEKAIFAHFRKIRHGVAVPERR